MVPRIFSLSRGTSCDDLKMGTKLVGDHLSRGTKLVGDRLYRGTKLFGDELSMGTEFFGTICSWGQEVGDRKSGDQMGSGPNELQPKVALLSTTKYLVKTGFILSNYQLRP